jgi:hypothetical protein
LSIFSTCLLNEQPINIFEDGFESRNFVYIDDVVNATIAGIERDINEYICVNVGAGVPISVLTVAKTLKTLYNAQSSVSVSGNYRIEDIHHNIADITVLKEQLEYQLATPFIDGIEKSAEWVKGQDIDRSAIMRYFPILYKRKIHDYYKNFLTTVFDKVLVINPERLSENTIDLIKKLTCASQFILYMWDSFAYKKRNKKLIRYFDKCLTFDTNDSKRLNIPRRPLFFLSDKQVKETYTEKIDVSFVGTGHTDRVKIMETIK